MQQSTSIPQYTLTLDSNTLKSGLLQYKIENSGGLANVNEELLKLKQKPGLTVKRTISPQPRLSAPEEPKNKKPKINFIIQSPPLANQKQPSKVQAPQILTASTPKTPPKAQILNVEKIPAMTTPTKQLLVPIMVRSDAPRTPIAPVADASSQIIQQALQMPSNQLPIEPKSAPNSPPFMMMKIQQNPDGQLTLVPAIQLLNNFN